MLSTSPASAGTTKTNRRNRTAASADTARASTQSTVVDLSHVGSADAPDNVPANWPTFTGPNGQFVLNTANITKLQRFVTRDASFWARRYQTDGTYRRQMAAIWAGTEKLHQDMAAGRLSVDEIRERSKQLTTLNLQAHGLVGTDGAYTSVTRHHLRNGGRAYALTSTTNNNWNQAPNATRIALSLLFQVLRSYYPQQELLFSGLTWTVNLGFVATQLTFSLLLPLRTARDQSESVALQALLLPTTCSIVSSECRIGQTVLPLTDPKIVAVQLNVVDGFIARLEISASPESLLTQLRSEVKNQSDQLYYQALVIVGRHAALLEQARREPGVVLTDEERVVLASKDAFEGLRAMLTLKNTPRSLDPDARRDIVDLVGEVDFWKQLETSLALAVPPDDGESERNSRDGTATDPMIVPVLADLKTLQARLRHLLVVMEGFNDLNKQTEAAKARIYRTVMNALASLLSGIPNARALMVSASATTAHLLGFGFYFDIALLATVLAQPIGYAYMLNRKVPLDLEGKSTLQNQLLHLTDPGRFTADDGQLDPHLLDKRMLSVGSTVKKHIDEGFKYDLQVLVQAILAYVVDPDTTEKAKARSVKMPNIVESKVGTTVVVHKGHIRKKLPRTFAELFKAFKACKSHAARSLFVTELCRRLDVPDDVERSMKLLLDQYRDIEISARQLGDNQLHSLLGEDSLLPPESRQIIAGSLVYAWYRYKMQKKGDDLPAVLKLEAMPEFALAKRMARALAHVKGRTESDALLGLLQALQKYYITYAGVVFGPGATNFFKAVSTLIGTFLEMGGESRIGTIVKLTSNTASFAGSLIGGIPVALGYQAYIKRKNSLRADAKLDPDTYINVAGASLLTQEGGFHLSLNYMQSKVQSHQLLLGKQIRQGRAPDAEDFPTFLYQYLSCFEPPLANDVTTYLEGQDEGTVPTDDDGDDASNDPQAADSDDEVVIPIPPLKYHNPYSFPKQVLANLNVASPDKWREFANAQFEKLSKIPDDELPAWIEDQLKQLQALIDEEEAAQDSGAQDNVPSSSSSDTPPNQGGVESPASNESPSQTPSSESSSADDPALTSALDELTTIGFLTTDTLTSRERTRLVDQYLKQIAPLLKTDAQTRQWRKVWSDRAELLKSALQDRELSDEQREAWARARVMVREMLKRPLGLGQAPLPKSTSGRRGQRTTSGAASTSGKPVEVPPMDLNDAIQWLTRAQLWSDRPLSRREQKDRVDQLFLSGAISRANWKRDYGHCRMVSTVLQQALGFPRVREDKGLALNIQQAIDMTALALQRFTEPPVQENAGSAQTSVQMPGTLNAQSLADVQAQLRTWGLWSDETLTVHQIRQQGHQSAVAWRSQARFSGAAAVQRLNRLLQQLFALQNDLDLPANAQAGINQSIDIIAAALERLRQPTASAADTPSRPAQPALPSFDAVVQSLTAHNLWSAEPVDVESDQRVNGFVESMSSLSLHDLNLCILELRAAKEVLNQARKASSRRDQRASVTESLTRVDMAERRLAQQAAAVQTGHSARPVI